MGDYFGQPAREADIHFIVNEINSFADCIETRQDIIGALKLSPRIGVYLEDKYRLDGCNSYNYFKGIISKWINLRANQANTVELDNAFRAIGWNAAADSVKDKWFSASRSDAADEANTSSVSNSGQLMKPIWFNMRDPISSFIGREDTLEKVYDVLFPADEGQQEKSHDKIKSTQVAIVGLGGIGKSEFARKFAKVYYTEFDRNVAWMNAESSKLLQESFKELAAEIGIDVTDVSGKQEILKMIKSVYKHFGERKSLFIFDNVESWFDGEDAIMDYLPVGLVPDSKPPYVLMTSRNRAKVSKNVVVISFSVITELEAVQLIQSRLETDNYGFPLQLTKLLGCLPLALQQAISYIQQEIESDISGMARQEVVAKCAQSYIEIFDNEAKKLLDYKNSGLDAEFVELKTTRVTWRITLDKIRRINQNAIPLLTMMSYISPDGIYLEMFKARFINDDLKAAVNALLDFSMITKHSVQSNIINVHRLVQTVVRLENEEKQESPLATMRWWQGSGIWRLATGREQNINKLKHKWLDSMLKLLRVILKKLPDKITPYTTSCIIHAQVAWDHALEYPELLKRFEEYPSNLYTKAKLHGMHTTNLSFLERTLSKYKEYNIYKESDEEYIAVQHLAECALRDKWCIVVYKGDRDAPILIQTGPSWPKKLSSIWFNMRKPIPSFMGREDTLSLVYNHFFPPNKEINPIQQVAIVGLGGVGKSEFARKFARKFHTQVGENAAWINAESAQLLIHSFKELATHIGIHAADLSGKGEILQMVNEVYEHFGARKSLFIFDNVESWFDGDDAIKDYLPIGLKPDSSTPYILMTSRNRPKVSKSVAIVELFVLTETEAVQLIQHRLDTENSEFLSQLAKLLGCLPLALQQAISYIQQKVEDNILGIPRPEVVTSCIKSYLENFDTKLGSPKLLDYKDNDFDADFEELKTMRLTWRITLAKICGINPRAIHLLTMMSYISPDNIHLEMFEALFTVDDLETAVNSLVRFSMITKISNIVSVHRLVQRVVRMDYEEKHAGTLGNEDEEGKWLESMLKLLNNILNQLPDSITPYATSCVNHAQMAWEHALACPTLLKQFEDYLSNLYNKAKLHGMHQTNLSLVERTLSTYKECSIYEESDKQYLRNQHLIVGALLDLHKYKKAKSLSKIIHKTAADKLGESHPLTLAILNNLTYAEYGLGNYSEQMTIIDKVITISTKSHNIGPKHFHVLTARHNKAVSLVKIKKYNEALGIFKSTLELTEEQYPQKLESINSTRCWIALATHRNGNSEEALQMFRNLHAELAERFGETHTRTLRCALGIGDCLLSLGRPEDAMEILKHNVELANKNPSAQVQRDRMQYSMAKVLFKMENHDDGISQLRIVLDDELSIYWETHPEMLTAREDLAHALQNAGCTGEALQHCKYVYENRKKVLGAQHPDTIKVNDYIGAICSKQSQIRLPDSKNDKVRSTCSIV